MLAGQIEGSVAAMLERRIRDRGLGVGTGSDVRLAGDSRGASVFYTVLGGDADHAGTAAALQSATGRIRSQVGKQMGLKFTPTLVFVPDAVPENARQIEDLLAAAKDGDAKVAEQAAGAAYAGEADPYRRPEDEDDDENA
mgnify:CR=1 FL=1